MDQTERGIKTTEIFHGKVVHLFVDDIELPNGKPSRREYCKHPGAVAVVAVDESGQVPMVRQFRYPFHRVLLEIPAGKLDPGEEILHSARRELSEETGIEAEKWISLGDFYSSCAILDEVIHLYLATGLTRHEMHPDSDEFLEIVEYPLEELVRMVADGEIPDGKTQAAILKAKLYLDAHS